MKKQSYHDDHDDDDHQQQDSILFLELEKNEEDCDDEEEEAALLLVQQNTTHDTSSNNFNKKRAMMIAFSSLILRIGIMLFAAAVTATIVFPLTGSIITSHNNDEKTTNNIIINTETTEAMDSSSKAALPPPATTATVTPTPTPNNFRVRSIPTSTTTSTTTPIPTKLPTKTMTTTTTTPSDVPSVFPSTTSPTTALPWTKQPRSTPSTDIPSPSPSDHVIIPSFSPSSSYDIPPSNRPSSTTTTTTTPSSSTHEEQESSSRKDKAIKCLKLRGKEGTWQYTPDQGYQYLTPLSGGVGLNDRSFRKEHNLTTQTTTEKQQQHENEYLNVTKWSWQDDQHDCPISRLTSEKFCRILGPNHLNVSRIYLVGDSLTFMMTQSLWKLLGNIDDPGSQFRGGVPPRFFSCRRSRHNDDNSTTTEKQHILEIEYTRIDRLMNHGWLDYYSSNPAKTLLIANTGLHITKNPSMFQANLDNFVKTVNDLNRTQDIVIFRTSVPGHNKCYDSNRTQEPFQNFSQFQYYQSIPSEFQKYGWDNVNEFNQYAQQKLLNHSLLLTLGAAATTTATTTTNNNDTNLLRPAPPHPSSQEKEGRHPNNWYLLDVYPMTILRPDGHNHVTDCLHYKLPGPPDWWNHLLFSSLVDIDVVLNT